MHRRHIASHRRHIAATSHPSLPHRLPSPHIASDRASSPQAAPHRLRPRRIASTATTSATSAPHRLMSPPSPPHRLMSPHIATTSPPIEYPPSNIEYPAANIQYYRQNIEYPTADIQYSPRKSYILQRQITHPAAASSPRSPQHRRMDSLEPQVHAAPSTYTFNRHRQRLFHHPIHTRLHMLRRLHHPIHLRLHLRGLFQHSPLPHERRSDLAPPHRLRHHPRQFDCQSHAGCIVAPHFLIPRRNMRRQRNMHQALSHVRHLQPLRPRLRTYLRCRLGLCLRGAHPGMGHMRLPTCLGACFHLLLRHACFTLLPTVPQTTHLAANTSRAPPFHPRQLDKLPLTAQLPRATKEKSPNTSEKTH